MAGSAGAADVFYETRLHSGREALAAGKHLEAAENLRIACFGLLDYPASLSPCLAMLAVAQNSLGHSEEVDGTLSRFVEVEKRFPSWDPAALDSSSRRSFDALIQQRIPRTSLATLPRVAAALGIARPVEARVAPAEVRPEPAIIRPMSDAVFNQPVIETEKPAATVTAKPAMSAPPVQTRVESTQKPAPPPSQPPVQKPAVTAAAKPPVAKPVATKPVATKPATQTPLKPVAATPKPPAQVTAIKPPTVPARVSGDPLGDARRFIADRRPGEAVKVLEAAVAQGPQRRDVRLALLQAAVFASDWKTGVMQIAALRPFRDSEAAYTFYAAVALYESGKRTEARELLVPVRTRLARSTWVDDYSKKILGTN